MASKYRELDLLGEQEQTLQQLHMKFSDQLNRLKVEELALTNLLRLQKEREMQAQTGTSDQNAQIGPTEEAIEQETLQVLDLLVSENQDSNQVEEEEEEDEEEGQSNDVNAYNDQLTLFLEDLLHQQKEQQQQLQLTVVKGLEEEEEEEEEEDT